ncbi:hypothetical protein PV328_003441 [Microctonus aethiopoides]|uniref:WAP domain-containing protein n=1 Tax=Microctonus aethiopoides TaxID=144406 RepID=A0AA39KKI1_9HYME|nr:hypothetical protein PV328_003441 [Microctonus aethiopoides]
MNSKMANLVILMITFGLINAQSYKSGFCPQRNSIHQCTPRCNTDYECSLGGKCCPNICGTTSCSSSSPVSTGGDGGYKGSFNSKRVDTSYCGGVKCRPYEKCGIDRNTKRQACVSA